MTRSSGLLAIVCAFVVTLAGTTCVAQPVAGAADGPGADFAQASYYPVSYGRDRAGGILSAAMPGLVGAAAGGVLGYKLGGAMGAVLGGLGGYLAGQFLTSALGLGPSSESYSRAYSDTFVPGPSADPASYLAEDALVDPASPDGTVDSGIQFQPLAPSSSVAAAGEGRRRDFLSRFDVNGNGTLDPEERDRVRAAWMTRLDTDKDGSVSAEERKAFRARREARWQAVAGDPDLKSAHDRFRAALDAYQRALRTGGAATSERAAFEQARATFHAKLGSVRGQ